MPADRTQWHLDQLSVAIAPLAAEFIDTVRSVNQLPVIITSSYRSTAEQRALVASGRSRTMHSKHLDGLAFDVDMYRWNRDDVPAWVWDEIGPLGESLGLTWGGRWASFRDVGHFEL
jgi:peptidoglycan L-alanyl-D-glutamate endopeptidase CwlK